MESNKGKIMGLTYLLNERKKLANLNKQTVQDEFSNLKAATSMMIQMGLEKLEAKVIQMKQNKSQGTKNIEVSLERKAKGSELQRYFI